MAVIYETASDTFTLALDYTNFIFTAVFIIEASLKLFTYRLAYFKVTWNKFDFFVVSASIFDIVISRVSTSNIPALKALPQLARIMRVLRVTRMLKLAGKNEGLSALISTVTLAIGPVMNVFVLLVLVLFIFSILGVFMFGNIDP